MALSTPCQTSGTDFHTHIVDNHIVVLIELPFDLDLTEEAAEMLEANLHNAMELVLAPYFVR